MVKLILFITLITDGVLLFFILFKKNKKIIHYLLLFGVLGILGWAISVYLVLLTSNFFIAKLTFFFALFFVFSLYWLTVIFPSGNFPRINLKILILCTFTFFVFIVLFFDNALFSSINIIDDYYIKVDTGNFSIFYTILIAFYVLSPIIILLKKRKNNSYSLIIKHQIKFLLIGYSLFALIIWFSNYLLPVYFEIYFFNGIGPSFSMIFVGFILFIIGRYSFLDIKLIIQRGIIYSTILSIIVGFYVSLIFVLGFFFQQATDATIILAAGIAAVFGIYSVPYLERYFQRITDRIFFKDKYDYSQAIYELSEILNKNIELNKLLIKTAKKLKDIFKVPLVTIILPDQQSAFDSDGKTRAPRARLSAGMISAIEKNTEILLIREKIPETINKLTLEGADQEIIKTVKQGYEIANKYGIEAYLAIKLKNKLIGFVVLTKKLSGDFFNAEDIKLLKTFSNQAAVALERAKLFGQVKAYSEKLEEKVRERTAKISGLQENQKMMMQETAHSLQTPITILKAELSQLGRETGMEKKFRPIERSIDRVSNFIYDILRLSRLESGGKDFSKEKFNLSEFLIELIESYEIITSEKNIKIESEIKPGIYIDGNKHAIEELISNLASNSVRYMKNKGSKKIKIYLKKKKDKIELIVADNGIGIDKQDIPRLFKRFYRVGNKGSKHEGTGLGLMICKEIVQKHNGGIIVESEKNKGAKFIVTLPIASKIGE